MHRIHWLEPSWQDGYGLGSMIYKLDDWTISGHAGGYPGYLTGFTLCREHNLGLILLTNALGSNPPEYINQGYKLVLPELIKATAKPKPAMRTRLAPIRRRVLPRMGLRKSHHPRRSVADRVA